MLGLSKNFGTSPWYYYVHHIYNEFAEIETYGLPILFFMSYKQGKGTLSPASGNGWMKKIFGETSHDKLTRSPFIVIFFVINFIAMTIVQHKEIRFLTSLMCIGNYIC